MAIVPQLIVLQRHGEVENLTSNYVVLLGIYRGCYVFNWIYRAATEKSYHFIWLMFIAGMVQTALYVDFFYYYAIRYAERSYCAGCGCCGLRDLILCVPIQQIPRQEDDAAVVNAARCSCQLARPRRSKIRRELGAQREAGERRE